MAGADGGKDGAVTGGKGVVIGQGREDERPLWFKFRIIILDQDIFV